MDRLEYTLVALALMLWLNRKSLDDTLRKSNKRVAMRTNQRKENPHPIHPPGTMPDE